MAGHCILGVTEMDQALFKILMIPDGVFSMIQIYHMLQD